MEQKIDQPLLPRVCVMLSTYNGAPYLAAQLDSLKAQEGVHLDLHVRDDGSTDETLAVLARYASVWPNLAEVKSGSNLKPAASFLELLRTAPDHADFYAFCDQDDVWLPRKLARAAQALADDQAPALYCSNVTCVTEDLSILGVPPRNDDPRLQHLLFENIASGCTAVLNRPLRSLIVESLPDPASIQMHDWWAALVAAAFGTVRYDPVPSILYRQHGGNSLGADVGLSAKALKQASLFIKKGRSYWHVHAQACEFLRLFGSQLKPADNAAVRALVESKKSWTGRLRYAASAKITRTHLIDAVAARGLIAAGWY